MSARRLYNPNNPSKDYYYVIQKWGKIAQNYILEHRKLWNCMLVREDGQVR